MADETSQQTPENEFAAAFAELAEIPVPKFTDTQVVTDPPAKIDPPAADVVDPPAKVDPPAAVVTDPPAKVDPPAPAEEVTPPVKIDPPALDQAAEIARLNAELAAAKAAPIVPATPVSEKVVETPIYTEDEKATLAKYHTEWPDVAKGEALARREEYRELVAYVFSEVRKELAPIAEFVESSSTETQYSKIVKLVPDYDEVRDKTLAWIDTQPAYLKTAYQEVTAKGSPSDVADLITRFKKETGYVEPVASAPAAATPAAPAAPSAPAVPVKPAVKNAAASLKVVQSSRTEATTAADPNDFESAFKEFAK